MKGDGSMEKKKILKLLLYSATFALSASIMVGAGLYKKSIPNESATFKVDLVAGVENQTLKPVVFDIQNEGLPKKLVQPGKIAISKSGITNKGIEPIWIQVQAEGFAGTTQITSSDPSFNEKDESFSSPILPGKTLSLSVNLDIPRQYIIQGYQISTGGIVLSDFKSGKLLAKIPVNVINSRFNQVGKLGITKKVLSVNNESTRLRV